jgi:hypothetical protein
MEENSPTIGAGNRGLGGWSKTLPIASFVVPFHVAIDHEVANHSYQREQENHGNDAEDHDLRIRLRRRAQKCHTPYVAGV